MGAGGVIILKNIKSALTVGCNKSGSVKLWHTLLLTHALAWAAGKFL